MRFRKGAGWILIVSLAVISVSIYTFFYPLANSLISYITGGGDSAICSLTVIGEGTARCPLNNVIISDDKVEVNNKKFMEKGTGSTQVMAKEALAKLMSICLSRGGGYNSQAFSRDNIFDDQVVCLECFNVDVSEDVGNIEGFTDYLSATNAKIPGSDKKYIEALTRDPEHLQAYMEYGSARGLAPSDGTFIFRPSTKYTIFFMGIKKGEISNVWDKISGTVRGDFLRVFFRNNDGYFSYIAESNRISEVCDRKVN